MQEKTRIFSEMTHLNVGFFASLAQARDWAQGPSSVVVNAVAQQP
jgi:hypothetical protein